jgi:glucose dehydrogenase
MYTNPIVVDGVMYISTHALKAVALNAATGAHKWSFDPVALHDGGYFISRNRGVTYWKGAEGERIFVFALNRVYAVDAKSGELLRSFGNSGHVDLPETSTRAICQNLLIVGSPGDILAFDTVTGQLKLSGRSTPSRERASLVTTRGTRLTVRPSAARVRGAGSLSMSSAAWSSPQPGRPTRSPIFMAGFAKGTICSPTPCLR